MDHMSLYELLRVILSAAQVVATLATPFMFMWMERRLKNKKDD